MTNRKSYFQGISELHLLTEEVHYNLPSRIEFRLPFLSKAIYLTYFNDVNGQLSAYLDQLGETSHIRAAVEMKENPPPPANVHTNTQSPCRTVYGYVPRRLAVFRRPNVNNS